VSYNASAVKNYNAKYVCLKNNAKQKNKQKAYYNVGVVGLDPGLSAVFQNSPLGVKFRPR
jgi:hypothetical protein